MYCPQCGEKISDDAGFCFKCGSALEGLPGKPEKSQGLKPAVQPPPMNRPPLPRLSEGSIVNRTALEQKYASMSYEQLSALSREDLTELAKECFDQELRRRRGIAKDLAEDLGPQPQSPTAASVTERAKHCPNCGFLNPDSAEHCDCGYDFTFQNTRSFATKAPQLKRPFSVVLLKGVRATAGGLLVFIGVIGTLSQISTLTLETLASAVLITGAGVAIWLSENAQPLGGRPYRWGKYVGIMAGIAATTFCVVDSIVMTISTPTRLTITSRLLFVFFPVFLVSVPGAVASVGLLKQKRYGVIAYLAMLTLCPMVFLALFLPSWGGLSGAASARLGITAGWVFLVLVVPNYIYFAKRWKFLVQKTN